MDKILKESKIRINELENNVFKARSVELENQHLSKIREGYIYIKNRKNKYMYYVYSLSSALFCFFLLVIDLSAVLISICTYAVLACPYGYGFL
jgi:hypothetical protein